MAGGRCGVPRQVQKLVETDPPPCELSDFGQHRLPAPRPAHGGGACALPWLTSHSLSRLRCPGPAAHAARARAVGAVQRLPRRLSGPGPSPVPSPATARLASHGRVNGRTRPGSHDPARPPGGAVDDAKAHVGGARRVGGFGGGRRARGRADVAGAQCVATRSVHCARPRPPGRGAGRYRDYGGSVPQLPTVRDWRAALRGPRARRAPASACAHGCPPTLTYPRSWPSLRAARPVPKPCAGRWRPPKRSRPGCAPRPTPSGAPFRGAARRLPKSRWTPSFSPASARLWQCKACRGLRGL